MPLTSLKSIATTFPAVFSTSTLPSEIKAADTYPLTVSRSIFRTITFLCVVPICWGQAECVNTDCRTFAEKVPYPTGVCSQIDNVVLLSACSKPGAQRCKCWLQSKLRVPRHPSKPLKKVATDYQCAAWPTPRD